MGAYGGPEIKDAGLALSLDAGNINSYPGSGTTWFNQAETGYDATLVNSPAFTYANGGYFLFNGSNTYATYPSASNLLTFGTADLSVSFWIYLNNLNSHTILTNYNAYNINFATYFAIVYLAGGTNKLGLIDSAGNFTTATTSMTASVWTHVCITKTGTTFNIYVNGAFVQSGTSASNNFSGTGRTILIGGGLPDLGYLNGRLALLQVSNTLFSAADVAQHYNATRSRFLTSSEVKSGLILDLDAGNTASYSGSGSTWTDLSGRGYNATIANSPTFTSNGSASYFTINNGVTNQTMQSSVPKPTMPVTISFWVYPQDVTNKLGLFDTAPNTQHTLRAYNGNIEWWNLNPAVSIVSSVANNNWYNIVAVYNFDTNRRISVYINGALVGSASGSTDSTLAWTTFIFGNNNGGVAGSFYGRVAKITIHSRALTTNEIGVNFDALRGRYGI